MSWIDQRPDDAMDGAFTVVAPGPIASDEQKLFRDAMARLGAAVHIITTAGPGGKSGFTATAVCSVSDQPATLLVCLNRGSVSAPILAENGVFCVNTLAANEEKLSRTGGLTRNLDRISRNHQRRRKIRVLEIDENGCAPLTSDGRTRRFRQHQRLGQNRIKRHCFTAQRFRSGCSDKSGHGHSMARIVTDVHRYRWVIENVSGWREILGN